MATGCNTGGVVNTPLAFTEEVLASYPGVLASFTVSSTNDSGDGSLREAIALANERVGADVIEFDASLTGEMISLTSGELLISDELEITGLGAENLTIDGQGNSRIFKIDNDNEDLQIRAEIEGLTITGGRTIEQESGAGIFNNEALILSDSVISGNTSNSRGGGIYTAGELTVNNSEIDNNIALTYGGAIGFSGSNNTVTVINQSTISGNSAGSDGGALNVQGTTTINNSTISGNTSARLGGAIDNGFESKLYINNSTVSGNSAGTRGGAIDNGGVITIKNSTFTENLAPDGAGISSFAREGESLVIKVGNSIISGNGELGNDVTGNYGSNFTGYVNPFVSYGNNLIGFGNVNNAFKQSGDAINILDPGLEPLADNGGLTQTHALSIDSPAINAGNNSLIPTGISEDQRGEPRIQQGFVDIGAFESNLTADLPLITLISTAFATEEGARGVFRVNRTGDPSNRLVIDLTAVAGEGLNPSDYNLRGVRGSFPNYSVIIPAGRSGVDITLTARRDRDIELPEDLTLTLEDGESYRVNTEARTATVSIVPETIIVSNTNDNGPGSLRNVINLANNAPGANTIELTG
ncbi:choice-of-anchor Q domain-containing protein [Gloeocapsa sp. PCC 73106]|uniref:choice-of-anchor Q domain-containing protein n=1 Tax=Gloeocapsa sp. PCC 73106 TaxID=102232 RepID=UPI0002ACC3B4|nr:choice-of-anchor Q domain-containing protein [Gloeocapsa sp. PCC 73106]ELR99973.1 hypothetical protein GLO73106DRAFT_00038270 [Gloeocapsa sp. PCC 73106]